jgi:hypothetical protein
MENWFYVEAKSFLFSVGLGSTKLGVVEKRKAFVGVVLLGSRCIAWLLSMLEEAVHNPGYKDFVKSFREGSKVTIVRRGENSSGHFLEVVVYDVGGRKGLVLFPEGRDGRGWSCISGELSKVSSFIEDDGTALGKVTGSLLFVEGVRLVAPVSVKSIEKQRGVKHVVPKIEAQQAVAWGELEQHLLLDLECSVVQRQPVDCYALEQHSLCPIGNTLWASDGSRRALACCRVFEDDGDLSEKEKASVFRKFLVLFGDWIDWANRLLPSLGLKRFGLKHKVSCPAGGWMFKRAKAVFSRAQSRVGSRCLGSKASSKLSDPTPVSVGDSGFVSSTLVCEGVLGSSGPSAVLPMALSSPSLAGVVLHFSSAVVLLQVRWWFPILQVWISSSLLCRRILISYLVGPFWLPLPQ